MTLSTLWEIVVNAPITGDVIVVVVIAGVVGVAALIAAVAKLDEKRW